MFWKKKEPHPRIKPEKSPPAPMEKKSSSDRLRDATSKLAESLSAYSEAAYGASHSEDDAELLEAYAKVDAARKLVTEGRLAYSLGRCLPEHMKYWPGWSQRKDFQTWVGFNASEIVATSSIEVAEGSRQVKIANIEFIFNASRYRFILRDRGMSYVPDSAEKLGEVELHVDDHCVAKFEIIEDIMKEYSEWEFSDVRALKVGPWMKDVIDMSTQIVASRQKRTANFLNERTRNAAKEIDLG